MRLPCCAIAVALLLPSCTSLRTGPGRCLPASARSAELAHAIRTEALPLVARGDYLGLGAEARRLSAWIAALSEPASAQLVRDGRLVRASTGERLRVSPRLAGALASLQQWYGLTDATLSRPITAGELSAAALSPASVERIASVFERSIRRGFWLGRRFHVPETGGEASLDGELRLPELPDPAWEAARELLGRLDDEQAIAALWDSRRAELAGLDNGRVLEFALEHWRAGASGAGAAVRLVARTLVDNAAGAYSLDPSGQFRLIVSTSWCGRYVGRWHTHPPHYGPAGWSAGDVPSYQDLQNAVRDGQFLTVAFQPDGFDLYDAAPLAEAGRVDLSLLRIVRHRSLAWKRRFERVRERLVAR